MNRIVLFFIMFFNFFKIFSQAKPSELHSKQIFLKEGWEFFFKEQKQWKKAQIPGSVQSNLIDLKLLKDPFFGDNEKDIQWVENQDWDFQYCFTLSKEDLAFDEIILHLEGLDTFAAVFLNGSQILWSENMFIGHQKSVKNRLRQGENRLFIRFFSPVNYLNPKRLTAGFEYPAGNDHSTEKVSVYARKAPYHFGWDWGIRVVQMGIFRPVFLEFYNRAKIQDSFVRQRHISEKQAYVEQQVSLQAQAPQSALLSTEILFEGKKILKKEQNVELKQGENDFLIPLVIENPNLWQPVGWGKPHRYDFITTLQIEGQTISTYHQKIGLRDIKLVQNKDEKGQSFYFKVNGNDFFAKGSNYIPGEILTTKQDTAYYHKIFDHILSANMNMVRVWGGGIYENDYFYELADQKGILVWQDFMFACTPYPSDDDFLQNIRQEAIYNIKRLRNFACISLWCGNNEVEESIKYWGFEKQVPSFAYQGFKESYKIVFQELLPEIVKELDPEKDYIHSSPLSANWGRPASLSVGDAHYWGVWYGRQDFEIFNTRVPRFMSEFGFQAFPELKTIASFAKEKDWDIDSAVMKAHQKSSTGNDAILEYMQRYYKTPENFQELVYLSLVMQGEGMKKGMLAHRRNRPYCMGSLYWQLNDSWPVVSWSGVDYYNNWKALHYKTREAFAPIGVDFYKNEAEQTAEFFIFNDYLHSFEGATYRISVFDFKGTPLKQLFQPITIAANATEQVLKVPLEDFLPKQQQKQSFILVEVFDKGQQLLAKDTFFFFWPKELLLPEASLSWTLLEQSPERVRVKITAQVLAKNVCIEVKEQGVKFSDNFFDLLPHQDKIVDIYALIDPSQLQLTALNIKKK